MAGLARGSALLYSREFLRHNVQNRPLRLVSSMLFRRGLMVTSNNPVSTESKSSYRSCRQRNISYAHGAPSSNSGRVRSYTIFGGVLTAIGLAYGWLRQGKSQCAESTCAIKAGARRSDLPNFRLANIEKQKGGDGQKMWVTYKEGVYDITEFAQGHPGGDKILLAAGGQLEPFWELYAAHNSDLVYEQLEELRIGNVHPDDLKAREAVKKDSSDPYANEPSRHPAMRVNSAKPFNAEPPPQLLIDNFITPQDLFFVRNHLPVPVIEEKKHVLEVSGVDSRKPLKLSIDQLKKKYKQHNVTAAVQCAGNRRADMIKHKAVKGLAWESTAISNAEWTGVKLADVLADAGLKVDDFAHVRFQGADKDIENQPYEASIPAVTAFDPNRDVMLVYEMNGKPLSRDHGFPLRVVVPGTVGARQVKWVTKVIASNEESKSHWQQNDYKCFNPSTDWHNARFDKAHAIQEYPIQSAICQPLPGTELPSDDEVNVRGYAWSGGGRGIIRVDVSTDGGKNWHEAELFTVPQPVHRQWAWTQWEITLPLSEEQRKDGKFEILCKAIDTSHNCQPRDVEGIWNLRGLINNAWHKVHVTVPRD